MSAPRFAILAVAVVAAVVSVALWVPLGEPLRYLRATLPAGAVLGSLALGAILFVLRGPLQSGARALTRLPRVGFVVPSLLATILFALSWAGSHGERAAEIGVLPQAVFPAVSGLFAFAVMRYGASVQRRGAFWFRARDRLGTRLRFVLLTLLTAAIAYQLPRTLGTAAALNEQLLVIVGMLAGYVLLAPRQDARAPGAGTTGNAPPAGAVTR